MKWAVWIVLVLLVLTQYELHALNTGFSVLIHSRMEDTQLANAHWREKNGIVHSLTTYREAMQTEEEFVKKHQDAVNAMAKEMDKAADAERIEHR